MAVGFWGRDVHCRLLAEQEHAKQRALLEAQISAGGLRAALWQSNDSGSKCACYKESNQQSDRKCKSCHGTGVLPGYLKFGYTTVWMSVVDTDITLTNVEITTDFKSAKAILVSTALTGTIESGDKPFTRSIVGSTWAYDVASFVRIESGSSVTVEYSLNSGVTWAAIATLPTVNPAAGVIRFRATLTRSSTAVLSPLFEIVRARFERIAYSSLQSNGSYRWGPWILVLRSVPKNRYTKSEHGDIPSRTDMSFWTAGLSMFDPSIAFGSDEELIKKEDEGPSDFIEILDGVGTGTRYVVIERQFSDPLGLFLVDQTFVSRMADPSGHYLLIW
jgi:hypothetical protein